MSLITPNHKVVAPASDLPHRNDIDGLRAIAVLLVIFNHLNLRFAHGGFIGVDIFFVISGYLITGNILGGLVSGKFALVDFYERRFRRIAPALTIMLAVVAIFAYWFLLPGELVHFGHALVAAACCFSNIYFSTLKEGYFGGNYSNLLLHTWSLGVEEQFYLVIPLGLLILTRLKKRPTPYLAVITVLSFAWAVWQTRTDSSKAFYMPSTRAWELLCGSLLACGSIPVMRSKVGRSVISLAALVGMGLFSWFYVPAIPFPGVSALMPCLAAVALILTGNHGDSFGYRLLTLKPLRFIGAISYSLYLWHWPVIVLMRQGLVSHVADQSWIGYVFVLVVSLALATLSWRFVERPFRFGTLRRLKARSIFILAGSSAVVLIAVGSMLITRRGFPQRFSAHEKQVAAAFDAPHEMREGMCFANLPEFNEKDCLHEEAKNNILLFGDSHAAALWRGLYTNFSTVNFLQVTAPSCHPTYGNYRRSPCSQLRKIFFNQYMYSLHLDGVVLTERWGEDSDPYDFLTSVDYFRKRSIPVTVIGPAPEYTIPLPFLLALGEKLNRSSLPDQNRVRRFDSLDRQLAGRLSGLSGVRYVSLIQAMCGTGCIEYADAQKTIPMLSDVDHFSPAGSIRVVAELKNRDLLTF